METKILAADLGNYDLKYWDGTGKPSAIRSLKFKLPTGKTALKYNTLNPVLELNSERYHFGFRAYDYRKQAHTTETEKAHEALLNTLACIEPPNAEFTLHVYTSHPRPEQFSDVIEQQLLGDWTYIRNGKKAIAHLESVCVEHEGIGAWRTAKSLNLIPEQGLTIVIDIGGGTWLSRLIDAEGEILDGSVSERGGAYSLASDISFDDRLKTAINDQPVPGIIMDGFASGSHYYGENPGASWREWLEEYREPWFREILGKVKNQYQQYLPRVRRFLITGGSSYLVAEKIQDTPLFAMTPHPRFDNVLGLLPVSVAAKVVR